MEQYSAKKTCIRLGLGLTVMALVTLITQTIWFLGEEDPIGDSSTWMWLGTVIPLYLLAIPSFLLITRKMPVTAWHQPFLAVAAHMRAVFVWRQHDRNDFGGSSLRRNCGECALYLYK